MKNIQFILFNLFEKNATFYLIPRNNTKKQETEVTHCQEKSKQRQLQTNRIE